MNRTNIFTDIYVNKKWGDNGTLSGEGSTVENTQTILQGLPELFERFNIKTIVDAPCGDYYWMKNIKYNFDKYTGADIVKPIIDKLSQEYSDTTHEFIQVDLCKDILPKADLILCRDCLMHLSNEDSKKVIENFKQSNSKYLLITTNPNNPMNVQINTGEFRHLNMTKEPFNFPQPIYLLNENFKMYNGMFSDKSLGLWLLKDL